MISARPRILIKVTFLKHFALEVGVSIVGMIRKYHNHKLQTNLRHREEEPHNNHKTPRRQTKQSKASSSLFPIEMIANLEWTQSNAQQNIEQLQNPTMGVKSTTIHVQQQNHRLRTDNSQGQNPWLLIGSI